jgi:hypothetical protein
MANGAAIEDLPLPRGEKNDALAKPSPACLAFDEAKQIGEDQTLPRHQTQRLAGFRSFDIRHETGEGHRPFRQLRPELPRATSCLGSLKVV